MQRSRRQLVYMFAAVAAIVYTVASILLPANLSPYQVRAQSSSDQANAPDHHLYVPSLQSPQSSAANDAAGLIKSTQGKSSNRLACDDQDSDGAAFLAFIFYLAPQEDDNIFPIIGFLHTLLFHGREFVAHLLSVW